jgi:hypothetical protein
VKICDISPFYSEYNPIPTAGALSPLSGCAGPLWIAGSDWLSMVEYAIGSFSFY